VSGLEHHSSSLGSVVSLEGSVNDLRYHDRWKLVCLRRASTTVQLTVKQPPNAKVRLVFVQMHAVSVKEQPDAGTYSARHCT